MGVDPYDEFASPYIGMGNDPVNNVDPDGGGVWDPIGKFLGNLFGGGGQPMAGAVCPSCAANNSGGFNTTNLVGGIVASIVGNWVGKQLFPLPTPNAQNLQSPSSKPTEAIIGVGLGTGTILTESVAITEAAVVAETVIVTETAVVAEAAGVTVVEGAGATLGGPVTVGLIALGGLTYWATKDAKPTGPPPADFYQKLGDIRTLPGLLPKIRPNPGPVQNPSKPGSNDDSEHEQYVLRANKTGLYPVMKWGKEKPVGWVKLKKGNVWKYGTTVNPDSRYDPVWLRKMHLDKLTQDTGSALYVLAKEGVRIIEYFIKHGKLPPGNTAFL